MASLEMWHRYGLVNVMAGGISIVSSLSYCKRSENLA